MKNLTNVIISLFMIFLISCAKENVNPDTNTGSKISGTWDVFTGIKTPEGNITYDEKDGKRITSFTTTYTDFDSESGTFFTDYGDDSDSGTYSYDYETKVMKISKKTYSTTFEGNNKFYSIRSDGNKFVYIRTK